jgi:cytochrome c peroxidase
MQNQLKVIGILLFIVTLLTAATDKLLENYLFKVPANFPKPSYAFENNPITKEGFELGRKLFYDPILSSDNIISCGFCHNQPAAFTHHGHDLSHGIEDRLGKRNAPPIQNLAWTNRFMWDGGVFDLDLQPIVPITSPDEMGETLPFVLKKLNSSKDYPILFKNAFGVSTITTDYLMKALSQFMNGLVSSNSKYDQVIRQEGAVFTEEEAAGYQVFKTHCASCHQEPLFTTNQFANNGMPMNQNDLGRYEITLLQEDKYLFKIPSLRNIMLTAPYMHDGSLNSIDDVLQHYRLNMQATTNLDKSFLQNGQMKRIKISDLEVKQLKQFLQTLTDSSFIHNPMFSEQ